MPIELGLIWRKSKSVAKGMFNISGWMFGALSLLVSISGSAKQAVATPLKAAAPWLAALLPYLLPIVYLVIAGLVAWFIYVTHVKQKAQIQDLQEDLKRANEVNQKQAQHQIDTEQLHRDEISQKELDHAALVESLQEEIRELQSELKCSCHGNLVADEVIFMQESLEDYLQLSPDEQEASLHRTLKLIARSIQQVTREADSLLHCAFYVPSGPIGKLKEFGWFHDELKGKSKTELSKKAKSFAERFRDSRDRGFMPYSLGDEKHPAYHVGVQALRHDDILFAVFVVVARSERALQSCDKILELFARMAGRLKTAKATLPSKAPAGLIPVRMEAPNE